MAYIEGLAKKLEGEGQRNVATLLRVVIIPYNRWFDAERQAIKQLDETARSMLYEELVNDTIQCVASMLTTTLGSTYTPEALPSIAQDKLEGLGLAIMKTMNRTDDFKNPMQEA